MEEDKIMRMYFYYIFFYYIAHMEENRIKLKDEYFLFKFSTYIINLFIICII